MRYIYILTNYRPENIRRIDTSFRIYEKKITVRHVPYFSEIYCNVALVSS
jgi:hypothetical protein